ncbi:MAG: ABC-type oligopeptide transport system,periplasmic component [Armatimonadetes bacterium]|nr:ABC-type oligopeptide transport system,periplasmic component [Armatimonadota bacterium]
MRILNLPPLRVFCRLLTAAAALPVLLAGCSNNPYPASDASGSVIYRLLQADLRTLDPTKSYTVDEGYVVDLLYPGYYRYHYLKQDPYLLELNLGAEEAKREPYSFPDPKTGKQIHGERWTFTIKPGMRFQDDPCFPGGKGREIVPEDFLRSFKRMADPAIGCPILGFLEDKIVGLPEYAEACRQRKASGKTPAEQAPDLQATVPGLQLDPRNPHAFRILLTQPYPQLRYLMAMHFTSPLANEAVAAYGKELRVHPVGCGPYRLKEYTKKQQIVLEANPNRTPEYYPTEGGPGDQEAGLLADAGKQLPLAEKVVFRFIPERITAWNLFLQGYLDRYSVTQDNFRQVMSPMGGLSPEMQRKGVVLSKVASPNTYYFGFNMEDKTYGGLSPKARKLRQAISLAIDSQEFIDLLYEGNGRAPEWLLPPGIAGYDPDYKNPYRRADLNRAKQLLAEAGYPEGIGSDGNRLVLTYDNRDDTPEDRRGERPGTSSGRTAWTRAISSSWATAGSPTTRTRRTSSSCCTVRTSGPGRTIPTTRTRSTTGYSSRCAPWTMARRGWR